MAKSLLCTVYPLAATTQRESMTVQMKGGKWIRPQSAHGRGFQKKTTMWLRFAGIKVKDIHHTYKPTADKPHFGVNRSNLQGDRAARIFNSCYLAKQYDLRILILF